MDLKEKLYYKFFFTIPGTRVILNLAKVKEFARTRCHTKTPGCKPGVLCYWLIVLFILSIQPFAYVVADYTCHNREYKVKEFYQNATPFLPG